MIADNFSLSAYFQRIGIRAPMRLDLAEAGVRQDFDTFKLQQSAPGNYILQALVAGGEVETRTILPEQRASVLAHYFGLTT